MRAVSFLITLMFLAVSTVSEAYTQATSDTLDWRAYYPLEIGNAWEYDVRTADGDDHRYDRLEIAADSVVGGQRYFVQVQRSYDEDRYPIENDTLLLRYDADLRTVVRLDSTERAVDLWGTLRICDLSLGTSSCSSGESVSLTYLPYGSIYMGWSTLESGATKTYANESYSARFVHGYGLVEWKALHSDHPRRDLRYMRIGGAEFGNPFSINLPKLPVADTLDWRGYFPLEVGNTWELTTWTPGGCSGNYRMLRLVVVDDTLVDGRSVFDLAVQKWGYSPCYSEAYSKHSESRHQVSYDEEARRVVDFPLEPGPCDLQAPFNSRQCRDDVIVSGGYVDSVKVGGETVEVDAVKLFDMEIGPDLELAHGLGLVMFWDFVAMRYVANYVSVGGRTFGTSNLKSNTSVGAGEQPSSHPSLNGVAPNPAAGSAAITFTAAHSQRLTIAVFDALGRRIAVVSDGTYPPGRHTAMWDTKGQPNGLYIVRMTSGGSTSSRTLVVAR